MSVLATAAGPVGGGRYDYAMSHDDLHFGSRPTLRGSVRLTRRGRLLLLLLLALVAFGLFSLGRVSGNADTSGVASTATRYEQLVVQPGDTLWSIAKAQHPGADPRGYVARIVELNGLRSADVAVGQTIALP